MDGAPVEKGKARINQPNEAEVANSFSGAFGGKFRRTFWRTEFDQSTAIGRTAGVWLWTSRTRSHATGREVELSWTTVDVLVVLLAQGMTCGAGNEA